MLQFGLRAHDFGTLPAERLADALAPFKPVSIQLALTKALADSPYKTGALSPGYARRLRRIFEERGIAIAVLGCYINPVHPDADAREKALRSFEEHLRFARDFGCAVVGTETGSRNADCSWHPDTETDETFDLLCSSIERLVRTAERYGSIVGVEAVASQHTVSTIERMEKLLARVDSPNLQVIYDPVNLIPVEGLTESQDDFFARAFAAFGPRIVAVHIKDFRMEQGKKIGTLPSGTGELDYPALFRRLQAVKPYVDTLLENSKPASLSETLDFVRRIERETQP
jgi:sugar phosphate isomerase/epimerase